MQTKDKIEAATVVIALAVLGVSSLAMATVFNRLWMGERSIFILADVLAIPFSGNRDVPVLVAVGLLCGWFLLFVLDGTKRVQAVLVSLAFAVSVGGYLQATGRILEAIGRTPIAFAFGLVLGVVSGTVYAELFGVKRPSDAGLTETLAWVQFPTAAEALRHSVTLFVLLGIGDYILIAPPFAAAGTAVAGFGLLISLSVFMSYDYQRNVVTLSPPDPDGRRKFQPYVFGGLYDRAKDDYHGFSIRGGSDLVSAQVADSMRNLELFDQPVAFAFASGVYSDRESGIERLGRRVLPRTATIESRGYTTPELPDITTDKTSHPLQGYAMLVGSGLRRHLVTLVPKVIRSRLPRAGLTIVDRFDAADTILLIGPTLTDRDETPNGLETFVQICRRYQNDPTTEVLLATTEAEEAVDVEAISMDDEELKLDARRYLGLGREEISTYDIYPLSRFSKAGPKGFTVLLERLSE